MAGETVGWEKEMIKFIVAGAGLVVAGIGFVVGTSAHTVTLPASGQPYNCGSAWSPKESVLGLPSIDRTCEAALRSLDTSAWVLVGLGGFLVLAIGLILVAREGQKSATP